MAAARRKSAARSRASRGETSDSQVALAAAALRSLRHEEAIALAREVLTAHPGHDAAAEILAVALVEVGRRDDAIAALERAVAGGAGPGVQARLAGQRMAAGRFEAALQAYDAVVSDGAGDPSTNRAAEAGRAECLERMGRPDEAVAALRPHLCGAETPAPIAAVAVRVLARETPDDAIALGRAVHVAARPGSPADRDPAVRDLRLSLARQLERAGDAAGAYDLAAAAHRGLRAPFDLMVFGRMVDAIVRGFPAERVAAIREANAGRVAGRRAVFIVGAPRCGSTLLERMLARHPDMVGLGEIPTFHRLAARLAETAARGDLSPDAAREAGDAYLATGDELAGIDGAAPEIRLINKDLGVLLHAGLAAMLLPGCLVVRVRRAPVDHGLAIWLERLRPSAAPWAADLRHIGAVLRRHDRLAEHWSEVLGDRFMQVAYEDLVTDPEPQLRPVLDAAGLAWDPACLDFAGGERVERTLSYDQARRPLSRASIGRSERYGARLDPLRKALGLPAWTGDDDSTVEGSTP